MEKFKTALMNYLERNENFALFIDGEWGTGKSYYLENTFIPNEISNENNEVNSNKEYKKEVISLYGKHNLKDIQEIIVTKILSHVDESIFQENLKKGINNIIKMFDIKYLNTENITASIDDYLETKALDKIKKELSENEKQVVLIIDDIERLSDNVSLKQLLGFIRNVLLDSFGCKVILVGNRKEIKDVNKNELDAYWEKVISRNLKFPSNLEVGKEMLKNEYINTTFEEKEIQNLVELIDLASKSEDHTNVLNLRTLNLVITDFKNIYEKMENAKTQSTITRMTLFTSLYILHNINRSNILTEKAFKELNVISRFSFTNAKNGEKKSEREILYNLYFKENEIVNKYAYFSSELKNYILKGELNTEKYQEEIHENFSVNNVEEDIAYILKNFFLYNEEKFLSVLKSAVDIIKEGEYAFGYRLNIYMKIKELSKKNIVSYSKNQLDDLEKALLKKYELQISNSISGEDILDLKDFHFDPKLNLNNYKKELSRKMKDLQDKYLDEKGINHQYIQSILNEDRKTRSELEMEYREIERGYL